MKFGPDNRFVGKNLQEIIDCAGPSTSFGCMDHRTAVAQWKRGKLIAEAWLGNEICVAIETRSTRKS